MCSPYKSLLMPLYKPPCMLRVGLAKSEALLGGASRRRTAQYFGFPYRSGPPKALGHQSILPDRLANLGPGC